MNQCTLVCNASIHSGCGDIKICDQRQAVWKFKNIDSCYFPSTAVSGEIKHDPNTINSYTSWTALTINRNTSNVKRFVVVPHFHTCANRQSDIALCLCIPGHSTKLIADVCTDKRLAVMLDADGESFLYATFAFAVNDNVNVATIHFAHGIVVEVYIICTTCNAILDVVNASNV